MYMPQQYTIDCQSAVGYLAVYRLCFALAAFFFIMSIIMIGVKSSQDKRAGIQNGLVFLFIFKTFLYYFFICIKILTESVL